MSQETLINWEQDRTEPAIRHWPQIIDYLGFDPYPPPRSDGERLVAIRRNLGLSAKRLASLIGVDEATMAKWQRNRGRPTTTQWWTVYELTHIDRFPKGKPDGLIDDELG